MTGRLTDPEDAKLVTLARSARARTGAAAAAAVRDADGRTYTAVGVNLPSLRLSPAAAVVAAAASSGAPALGAVGVVGPGDAAADADLTVLRELAGPGVPVHLIEPGGALLATAST